MLNAGALLALQAKAGGCSTWVCCEAFKHMGISFSAKVVMDGGDKQKINDPTGKVTSLRGNERNNS